MTTAKTAKQTEIMGLFSRNGTEAGAAFRASVTAETAAGMIAVAIGNFAGFVGCKPAKITELLGTMTIKVGSATKADAPAATSAKPAASAAAKTITSNPLGLEFGETVYVHDWDDAGPYKATIESINGSKVTVLFDDNSTSSVKIASLTRKKGEKPASAGAAAPTTPAKPAKAAKAAAPAAEAPAKAKPGRKPGYKVGQVVETTYKANDGEIYTASATIVDIDKEAGKAKLKWVDGEGAITRKLDTLTATAQPAA